MASNPACQRGWFAAAAVFDEIWEAMAERGECDSLGSAEANRVWHEWVGAGRPHDIAAFIRQAANRPYMPEGGGA